MFHQPLKGQRALVTGANSGIGEGVALALGAARVVSEQLEQFGQQREEIRRKLVEADQLARVADALLIAFGATGRCLLVPAGDLAQRSRIVGKAVERVLADLEASSPETVRDRVKALIRQVTVEADGRVVVEGSWKPVVQEELRRTGDARAADACVRTTLVPGERSHNCAMDQR